MSKKLRITNLLKTISKEWASTEEKIKQIYADNDYTQEFKDRQAEELQSTINNYLEQAKGMIISIVDEKLQSLFKPVGNTFDVGYQSRLTNVLSILTLAGSEIDLRDLQSMLEPFNKDYTALQAIRAAITAAGIDKQGAFPSVPSYLATGALEDRKDTHRKLVKLKIH